MQLKEMRFRDVFAARFKKMILDMTSVKFEFVIFIAYAMWEGKIQPIVALPTMMVALGMREYIDFLAKKNGG